jgi:hypothetical protein
MGDDNGKNFKTRMVARLVGIPASSSGEKLDINNGRIDRARRSSAEPRLQDIAPSVDDITGLDSL